MPSNSAPTLAVPDALVMLAKQHNDTMVSWLELWGQHSQERLAQVVERLETTSAVSRVRGEQRSQSLAQCWPFAPITSNGVCGAKSVLESFTPWSALAESARQAARQALGLTVAQASDVLEKAKAQSGAGADVLKPVLLGQQVRLRQAESFADYALKKSSSWAQFCKEQTDILVGGSSR